MRRLLFSVFLILNHCFLYAQNFEWAKQFGDYNSRIAPHNSARDKNNNLYVCGTSYGRADFDPDTTQAIGNNLEGWADLFLAKYDSNGEFVWVKTFASGASFQNKSLKIDRQGNVIIAGEFSDSVDFDPSPNTYFLWCNSADSYVCKYDSMGDIIWGYTTAFDIESMDVDDNNNIYYTGSNGGCDLDWGPGVFYAPGGNIDAAIVKVNSLGAFQWGKGFVGNICYATNLCIDKNKNINTSGFFNGTIDFDPGLSQSISTSNQYRLFLNSLDSNGNFRWNTVIQSCNIPMGTLNLKSDYNNNLIISGNYKDSLIFFDGVNYTKFHSPTFCISPKFFISKFNTNGQFLWAKSLGDPLNNVQIVTNKNALVVDSINNIYAQGGFATTTVADFDPDTLFNTNTINNKYIDVFLLKLDSSGTFNYVKHFEYNQVGFYFDYITECLLSDDFNKEPVIVGNFEFEADFDPNVGVVKVKSYYEDMFMLSLDFDGNFEKVKVLKTSGMAIYTRKTITKDNFIYLIGDFEHGKFDINPAPSITNIIEGGYHTAFLAKFDLNGNYIWSKVFRGNAYSTIMFMDIEFDQNYDIYLGGVFHDTIDFDPGPNVNNIGPNGRSDNYLLKLDSAGNFIWVKKFGANGIDNESVKKIKYNSILNKIIITGMLPDPADIDPGPSTFYLYPMGSTDFYVAQFDTAGNFNWAKNVGGIGHVFATSLDLDNLGNMILSGIFEDTVDFDPGPNVHYLTEYPGTNDSYILKLTPTGDFIFVKHYSQFIHGIIINSNDEIVFTGDYYDSINLDTTVSNFTLTTQYVTGEVFLCNLNSAGDFQWAKRFGGKGKASSLFLSADINYNLYLTGYFEDTIDFDPNLNINNLSTLITPFNGPSSDLFLIKLNKDGSLIWMNNYVANQPNLICGIVSISNDTSGNLYATGNYGSDSITFNSAFLPQSRLFNKYYNCFLLKLSQCPYDNDTIVAHGCNEYNFNNDNFTQTGVYTIITGCDSIVTLNLAIDTLLNNVYASNDTIFTTIGNPTYQWIDCATNIPITGATMGYYVTNGMGGSFAVITSNPNCIDTSACLNIFPLQISDQTASAIYFYPNPASDVLTIKSRGNNMESVSILSVQGSLIRKIHVDSKNEYTIDISDLTSGIYILKMETKNHSYFSKFIKQW